MATYRPFRRRLVLCGAALATVIAGVAATTLPARAAEAPAAGGTYTIATAGQCLAAGGSTVTAATCASGAASQQWRVEARGSRFGLVNAAGGQCLAGAGGLGTALTTAACNTSGTDQRSPGWSPPA